MYRVTPYRNTLRTNNKTYRDVFDLFDDFFTERDYGYRKFKLDVRDTGTEYIIDADLPGITKEEMSVHFENEQLIISINREEQKEEDLKDYLHKERTVESYERRINLKDVDPKAFKASLNNGVLTITAPKLEEKVNKYLIDIE